ncbi:hypothetical protein EN943_04540 [Mesorhizobium sp. M7A.F.Ca.US.006.01.1.1]|nr:hypothetical protein EN943_04540 [Mesorhizobium sp. M7A.F.Ca.US.006.01.1.1]
MRERICPAPYAKDGCKGRGASAAALTLPLVGRVDEPALRSNAGETGWGAALRRDGGARQNEAREPPATTFHPTYERDLSQIWRRHHDERAEPARAGASRLFSKGSVQNR